MKRIIAAITLFLLATTTPVQAAGPYDGIYTFNFNGSLVGFTSIHENNGVVIAMILEPSPFDSTWEAIRGIRNGNTVRLNSIYGTVTLLIDLTFNADNATGTATVVSCSDNDDNPANDDDNCDFPPGSNFHLIKIF